MATIGKNPSLSSRQELSFFSLPGKKVVVWFCIALLGRWLFSLLYQPPVYSDMQDYQRIAYEIIRGQYNYAHIYRPPFYPLFLAGVYKIFGTGSGGYLAVRLVQGLLSAVSCWLVFKIAGRFGDSRVAYLSYIITIFYFPYVAFSSVLLTETLFTFFLLLTILCLLRFAETPGTNYIILAGITAGLTSLTRSTLLAAIPFIALWMLFSLKLGGKKTLGYFACFCLTTLIVLSPQIARNYNMTGQIQLTSFNGGVNFALGAGMPYAQKLQVPSKLSEKGLPLFKSSRIFYKIGWERIKAAPLQYLSRMSEKLIKFFGSKAYFPFFQYRAGTTQLELAHNPHNKMGYYLLHSLFVISRIFFIALVFPGSVLAFFSVKRDEEQPRVTLHLLGAIIFAYTLLHLFFIVGSSRMRMPVDALFIILAAYSYMKLLTLYRERKGG